ncbi:winged helix-turn-helix domain-containing protein [Streptomyces niveiscabiei]|uniref:winged helix-turn-helix domain-containing protein n=1 Tax=Streptomyces niveiscabiei TaxID=164115 RepID=UPI0029B072D9|nr:winged helix-turn-helix domain-containing protein [Streptomyces niveiscabiei]MDX3386094.1 winged helix-turn-helix domain-containing protein [Streptomyces niveiscabiei]
MRYADGGGLTAVGRVKREAVRFEAAEMFGQGVRPPEVARRLRVSRKSAYAWHAAWRQGGSAALASKGAGGFPCRLDDVQAERLQAELEAGPAAHGWLEDQRWTLARVAELIHRLFGHRYTPRGVSYLLHRLGWSPQVPAHRAVERDEQAVGLWRTAQWSRVRGRPGSWAHGQSSRTRPGRT